jgi:hypothetical protein
MQVHIWFDCIPAVLLLLLGKGLGNSCDPVADAWWQQASVYPTAIMHLHPALIYIQAISVCPCSLLLFSNPWMLLACSNRS